MDTIEKIKLCLTNDLRKPKYRGHPNKLRGHCYIASEAYYHMIGKELGYKPHYLKVDGDTHWFLKRGDEVIDITKDQFDFELNYSKSIGCGFLTKPPSKRCMSILLNMLRLEVKELKNNLECI